MIANDRFQNISVLGAAGKMGSGILYLNVLYISKLAINPENCHKCYTINAIDRSQAQLNQLLQYTKGLLLKWAEKNIIWLRAMYAEKPELIENGQIIEAYINESMALIKPSTRIESAFESTLVFEAVIEDLELKTQLLSTIKTKNPNHPWFFTNTSSIPIHILNEAAQLNGDIVGCHFYNPPAVQKLIEVIELKNSNAELSKLVFEFGKDLGKTMVPSNDIAGFIGNGFFMRDLLYGIEKATQLKESFSYAESILLIDTVSRDFILRPMGIFQLMDYVGLDVCHFILNVMNTYLDENLQSSLLLDLLNKNIKGGQHSDGSQKPGFFTYSKGKIETVYDCDKGMYTPLNDMNQKIKEYLGTVPDDAKWKSLSVDPQKKEKIHIYFTKLAQTDGKGAQLAMEYMKQMKSIGAQLVKQGVTETAENVNTVMITGFHHLYGPINDYC
jgi:3-hydroxyacyl-CoA dehydrogenase